MADSEIDLERRLRRQGRQGGRIYKIVLGVGAVLAMVAVVAIFGGRALLAGDSFGSAEETTAEGPTVVVSWFITDPNVDDTTVPQRELASHLERLASREPNARVVIHTDNEIKARQVKHWAQQAGLRVDATRVETTAP